MTDRALATVSPAVPIPSASSLTTAMAGELVAHVLAELPALGVLEDRV
jgi:hypothetical protein